jgi:saccharopine dehydrogenase-like NADP-dependent oxidoreductase
MEKKNILILGAGLSSSSLVEYLLHAAEPHGWLVTVGDLSREAAEQKVKGHAAGRAVAFDADRAELRDAAIGAADVVISMLPARMHPTVAECCVRLGKHMITASYVSDEMRALDGAARGKGLLLLNEMGVDPGIDHMSAMRVIDRIKAAGGKLSSFESSTGGLVAPEHDDNPWNYKFTWHPSNVVTAGQGVSRFLHNGRIKYIPYHKIFRRTELVEVLDVGAFEVYANRDSLKYKEIYGLDDIQTLFRGTMRRPGYSKAWDVFVQLGMTEQTYVLEDSEQMTYRDFLNSYLPYAKNVPLETKLAGYLGIDEESDEMQKIKWCGIFEAKRIGLPRATPARILQNLLEPKWQLGPQDLDMIVMQHVFKAEFDDVRRQITSSLVFKGRDTTHTAMAMTVGIPVAIAAKLLLTGRIRATGVQIPITREIYEPVLAELADLGVRFVERETVVED